MTGKRSAHARFPEVIAAAVRVFATDGYKAARMSDVAREAGLSEAALYRYVDGKEDLFVLAIRHSLLLEPLPAEDDPNGAFPLKAPPLADMIREAREFVAAEVPFGSLADALVRAEVSDPAAELESIMRELFTLEEQTSQAADMIERSARELPELADLLNSGPSRGRGACAAHDPRRARHRHSRAGPRSDRRVRRPGPTGELGRPSRYLHHGRRGLRLVVQGRANLQQIRSRQVLKFGK